MSTAAEPPPISRSMARRRSSAAIPFADDGADTCRICRGEALAEQPLFYPCKCSGSIKYVHQDCLMEWLSRTQKKHCELCKTPFHFTKLYDQSMPEHVPWALFLRQLVIHTFRAVGTWARYTIVIFVWLCWLPWTIRQIWRALFWIADGSWLTRQELEVAVQEYASHLSNSSVTASLTSVVSNATIDGSGASSVGLASTMFAILGFLDPQIIMRTVIRTLLHLVVYPTVLNEPIKWEKAFLFAPLPRPPSLLSDFQTVASATRFPILNNALIDVLEGQLICLAIVTAFILVFLIREWVVNQQPLLNIPEEDPADDAVPVRQPDAPIPAARRRRRPVRPHIEENVQLQNRPVLPARPRVVPRRHATENNILVPSNNEDQNRPIVPQRARSLVSDLQELEDNLNQWEDISDLDVTQPNPFAQTQPLQSPPLQRGVFDNVGQIRRSIEEQSGDAKFTNEVTSPIIDQTEAVNPISASSVLSLERPADSVDGFVAIDTSPVADFSELQLEQSQFTFRSDKQFAEPDWLDTNPVFQTHSEVEAHSQSITTNDIPDPPQASSSHAPKVFASEGSIKEHDSHSEDENSTEQEAEVDTDADGGQMQNEEPDNMLARLSKWLWHTDDYIPLDARDPETPETEIVADVNGQGRAIPAQRNRGQENAAEDNVAVEDPLPDLQDGVNLNDANAVEDAEDLEGILELIGMEGPFAGMVQNLIFSVFLITLTLSASVWCPYIWGKITLLFIAHPFSVFVRAPLYLLSRSADFIIDIGLFTVGLCGILLNHITKIIKVVTLPVVPRFSNFLDTDLIERLAFSLSQNSGARLEKSVTKTILGFRPDLPTFSVQSHHVLRVLM